MKKRSLIFKTITLVVMTLLFSIVSDAKSQGNPPKLPPFRIKLANGTIYKAESLPVGKPVLLFYFSPDCDHCTALMNEFFKMPDEFKKATVVMITYLPVLRVGQFNEEYKVKKYSNLVVGTEEMSFFVKNYYNVMDMPFAALHDKNGNLVTSYSRNVPLKVLSSTINRLQ